MVFDFLEDFCKAAKAFRDMANTPATLRFQGSNLKPMVATVENFDGSRFDYLLMPIRGT